MILALVGDRKDQTAAILAGRLIFAIAHARQRQEAAALAGQGIARSSAIAKIKQQLPRPCFAGIDVVGSL